MNKLNKDMQQALESVGFNKSDTDLLEQILYAERLNKTKEWTNDAVKKIRELIDKAEESQDDDGITTS